MVWWYNISNTPIYSLFGCVITPLSNYSLIKSRFLPLLLMQMARMWVSRYVKMQHYDILLLPHLIQYHHILIPICNLRLAVRCALYGIDEKDRCPNWKDGVYKPCQGGSESDSKKEGTESRWNKHVWVLVILKKKQPASRDKILLIVHWYLWGRYVMRIC